MGSMGILERLREGPVIGDGSYTMTLERRGYVTTNIWTPEVVMEEPTAVRQLHREFLRAGSDVIQTFNFFTSGGKLKVSGGETIDVMELTAQACKIAREEALPYKALVAGDISATPEYFEGNATKEDVQKIFRRQVEELKNNGVDFLIAEYFAAVEEAVWAVEVMKESDLPTAVCLRAGLKGDLNGIPPSECALRMAKSGADIIGINCIYDYKTGLKTMKIMKEALDAEGLRPYLMMQPLGFHTPDVEDEIHGYIALPEFPLALEPRLYTRFDARKFARAAFELGVNYIGGCCGFEPYHIREGMWFLSQLSKERERRSPAANKNDVFGQNAKVVPRIYEMVRERSTRDYWMNLKRTNITE